MRMQPRQQLLEIWQAAARLSYPQGKWVWGGVKGSNSISDAEQLLCLMLPATSLPPFRLDQPDETAPDVLDALRDLGDAVETPRLLVRVLLEYFEKYTDDSGTPVFCGDGYFDTPDGSEPTSEQSALDVVDSFTVSVTLSLAAMGFARGFRNLLRRAELRAEVDRLEQMASARLSAALVGLLRSFTVHVIDIDSPDGHALVSTVNQSGLPRRQVIAELHRSLRTLRAALREVTLGTVVDADLDNPSKLFECGWSWGIVKDAPQVLTTEQIGRQATGIAEAAPYLYFSVVALDGIAQLFSDRIRILGLLNEEQQRLVRALQVRWDITQAYWSTVASFDRTRWPLEDIPWRTTDNQESDYFSLLVTAMTVQDLVRRRAPDTELTRIGRILDELATRARITRRPHGSPDPAVVLHSPGVVLELGGAEKLGSARLRWVCADFSPLLLKRTLVLAGLVSDTDLRGQLLALADAVWDHLIRRRIKDGAALNLWDQVGGVFEQLQAPAQPSSWYYTERVVECLTAAAQLISEAALKNDRLATYARDLLNEADQLLDQELLRGLGGAGPATRELLTTVNLRLRRARLILHERPGTAVALAAEVLTDLDRLAAARAPIS